MKTGKLQHYNVGTRMLLGSSVLSNNRSPQTHIAINYIRSLFWYEISNNLDKNKKVSFFEHCVPMEGCFGVRRSMQLQSKTYELRQRPHISTSFNCHTFVHPPSLSPFPPCHTSGGGVTKKSDHTLMTLMMPTNDRHIDFSNRFVWFYF